MKTTLEIPDDLFRRAKATAALRGIPMRQLVTEALDEKVTAPNKKSQKPKSPPWMQGFGALSDLSEENKRITALIDAEFNTLEKEDLL